MNKTSIDQVVRNVRAAAHARAAYHRAVEALTVAIESIPRDGGTTMQSEACSDARDNVNYAILTVRYANQIAEESAASLLTTLALLTGARIPDRRDNNPQGATPMTTPKEPHP